MTDLLCVAGLSKKYKLYDSTYNRLAEALSFRNRQRHGEKWALKDVSFSLGEGESVAIVGANGSGKSTLLSIIVGSRVATAGSVHINGSVTALLELGLGFHPEFTGRENAVMGLQIQGLPDNEIAELLPQVEAFCELGEYFEHPIRTYSSGMQMRLAFSVATAKRPELLIVDEALAVGDTYFQHKSIHKIRELRDSGTSLLLVSHDASSVITLCDRALLLENGRVIQDGKPDQVMDYYNARIAQRQSSHIYQADRTTRSGSHEVKFTEALLLNTDNEPRDQFHVGERATIKCSFTSRKELLYPTIGFSIRDRLGTEVFGINTCQLADYTSPSKLDGLGVVEFFVDLNLGIGSYSITIAAHTDHTHLENNYDWWDHAIVFHVVPGNENEFRGTAYLDVTAVSGISDNHE